MQVNPIAKTLKIQSFLAVDCVGTGLYNKLNDSLERGKNMQKFTPVSNRNLKGNTVLIEPFIWAEEELSIPVETFCEYARKNGFSIAKGEGGIEIVKNSTLNKDEFRILITSQGIFINVQSVKAAHSALSVLLCELKMGENGIEAEESEINEAPDMFYRGLSVDLARQWHAPEYIIKYIDLCYFNRATHLQLHFTDDQSFTLPMEAYPKLSTEGRTYKKEDIAGFVKYANSRGIILVPEVDIPGHTEQFCRKYPELFGSVNAAENTGNADFVFNILPAAEEVFDALRTIFGEVAAMFPDSPYIHIGGDEAAVKNWEKEPRTLEYMQKNGIKNIHEMYAEFVRIVTEIIFDLGRTPIVWEGFSKEYNDRISKDVIVIAWESYYQPAPYLAEAGFRLINCSWKPLYIVTPDTFWSPEEIKAWDPWSWQHFWEKSAAYPNGLEIDPSYDKVLGGSICAWGDRLQFYDDPNKGADEEFELISERLPALCERLISLK